MGFGFGNELLEVVWQTVISSLNPWLTCIHKSNSLFYLMCEYSDTVSVKKCKKNKKKKHHLWAPKIVKILHFLEMENEKVSIGKAVFTFGCAILGIKHSFNHPIIQIRQNSLDRISSAFHMLSGLLPPNLHCTPSSSSNGVFPREVW